MKNRVNLYHPEFQPKLRLLTLSLAIGSWILAAFVCFGVYAYLSSQHQQLELEITRSEQDKKQQSRLIEELQNAVDSIKVDNNLLEEVDKNQRLINHKKRVLQELSGEEGLKSNGFSQLMLSLARHHQTGLWLTHINLDGTKVIIEGAANESSTIPKWVNTLSQTKYFRGQEFADTRLYRDTGQQLNFVLATGSQPEAEKGQINE